MARPLLASRRQRSWLDFVFHSLRLHKLVAAVHLHNVHLVNVHLYNVHLHNIHLHNVHLHKHILKSGKVCLRSWNSCTSTPESLNLPERYYERTSIQGLKYFSCLEISPASDLFLAILPKESGGKLIIHETNQSMQINRNRSLLHICWMESPPAQSLKRKRRKCCSRGELCS